MRGASAAGASFVSVPLIRLFWVIDMIYGALFVLVSAAILWQVNRTVPSPFIDEIFHVPQTQQYCNGSFSKWDNKITTPPGLYIAAVIIHLPLKVISTDFFCSVLLLRAVNVVFNTISFFLLYGIIKEIHGEKRHRKDSGAGDLLFKLQAFAVAIFPLNYFFSFLYYTDPGSTMFILSAYLANLKSHHKLSAFLGLLSVFFRQTNIVWVLFCAGSTVAKEMEKAEDIKNIETSAKIKDKLGRFLVSIIAAAVRYLLIVENMIQVVKLIWPYLCVMSLFVGFVYNNGGLTLGDKENHVATFHAVQILYFFGFALFFSSPHLISLSYFKKFINAFLNNPLKYAVLSALAVFLIIKHTYIHKFLLADNRHYTFYICRYLLNYPTLRIATLPIYIYSGWAVNLALEKPDCRGIWKLLFLFCTCAVTIPQRLIELRYFIVPYIIFRVNLPVTRYHQVFLEMLLYIVVNFATLYIFFSKEVYWENMDEPQRIIW